MDQDIRRKGKFEGVCKQIVGT